MGHTGENALTSQAKEGGGKEVENGTTTARGGMTRRDFVKYSAGTVACMYLGALAGCGGGGAARRGATQAATFR